MVTSEVKVATAEVAATMSLAGTVDDKGIVIAMQGGVRVKKVMMMRKVVRTMRRAENTTMRDSLTDEGERPRGRFWGL